MCGIAGVISQDDPEARRRVVESMCASLEHRGPDDMGIHVDEGLAIGMTRLSIIDLAGGHQPLGSADGSIWVVFNGEIYNFVELRRELQGRGHTFATNSDTEVLVHLYEDEGISLVHRLNGMFAFALWDASRRELYLVRDHVGVKPLYYRHDGSSLSFASELKAMVVDPAVPRELDLEAIASYLTLLYIPQPRSPLEGVSKLEPGTWLCFRDGRVTTHRYWHVPEAPSSSSRSLDDLAEEIRALLLDSVRLQLRADVPVGLFASGGIDSSALMWATAEHGLSLDAFLVEFDQLAVDTPYARLAAETFNMPLTQHDLSGVDAGRLLPRLVWYLDEPMADPSIVPTYLVSREAAKQVKVILNGTGGDELFGGYGRYNVRSLLPPGASAGVGRAVSRLTPLHKAAQRAAAALDYRNRYLSRMSVVPEARARALLGLTGPGEVRGQVESLFRASAGGDAAASMMYVDTHLYLPGDLFHMLDRMSMAASLEARVPLCDHRLVELAAGIPGDVRMQGGNLKWLLRRTLRGRLPDAILDRPKQGFGPPVAKWLDGALGVGARRLLRTPDGWVRRLIDPPVLDSLIGVEQPHSDITALRLWTLLVLELWCRTFLDGSDLSGASVDDLADDGMHRWI